MTRFRADECAVNYEDDAYETFGTFVLQHKVIIYTDGMVVMFSN